MYIGGFPDSLVGKDSACNAGDMGSIPGLGRSSGEGIGYLLQHSAGEFHGLCSLWGCKESDMTERLSLSKCMCIYIYIKYTHICIITYKDETKETLFIVLGGCTYIGAHFSLIMLGFIPASWSQHIYSLKFIHSKSI